MMKGQHTYTLINSYVQTLLSAAYEKGFTKEAVFAPFERKSLPEKTSDRLSVTFNTRLWQRIAELTGDPDLGLHVGEKMRPGSFHIVSQIVMNTPVVSESMETMVKYQSLTSEGGRLSLSKTDTGHELIYTPNTLPVPMTRFQIECIFSSIVTLSRWSLDTDVSPLKVCFYHSVEHDHREYRRIFNCPVYFGQKQNSILIPNTTLAMAIPHADPELRIQYEQIADKLLESLAQKNKFSQNLKEWLLNQDEIHQVSIEAAASFCNMAPRTLQRKLMNEKTSYKDLKSSVLMEMAHQLLIYTDMPVSRVAEKLGYINDSSFHRGFKKWFDLTPQQYRHQLAH